MTHRSPYVLTSAAVTATAVVGGVGTAVGSRWYRQLDKPAWQPPGAVFGPVWTTLYALLALAGGRALSVPGPGSDRYLRAFLANLVLNAGWSWLFFRARRPALATAEAVLLAASTADLARRSWARDRWSGAALLPYAAWTSFAAVLSATIARRNRR
ncbi:tryptophan-rich sensory protein [Geodermatophilus sp. TF02-6]|uniref:TspO/MBR family protein n=1 Tax=Geodermatophilus sp. TF02-6 TaxID=2250575 RepID=UPI000DEA0694|nr:TspO/MBR family protein [Geodermatophilus sp. TF02-6]RBY76090.1 tryptophan-rich sensory protein [Geodermatophilus sp. TF02-6]